VIEKTWRESSGLWVLFDILRNYGSISTHSLCFSHHFDSYQILFVKIWILAFAWWWLWCIGGSDIFSLGLSSSLCFVSCFIFVDNSYILNNAQIIFG
jgi:hypothetical protein